MIFPSIKMNLWRSIFCLLFIFTFSNIKYISFTSGIDDGFCTMELPCKTFDYILDFNETSISISILNNNSSSIQWNCEDPVSISSKIITVYPEFGHFTFINNPECPLNPFGLFYLNTAQLFLSNITFQSFQRAFISSETSYVSLNHVNLLNFTKGNPFKGNFLGLMINNFTMNGYDLISNINLEKSSPLQFFNVFSVGATFNINGHHSDSIVQVKNSKFEGLKSYKKDGGILSVNSASLVDIYQSTFENTIGNKGGAIFLKRIKKINIIESMFKNMNGYKGGALYIEDYTDGFFYNCSFFDNVGIQGGSIYLDGQLSTFANNIFRNNMARNGGAIYIYTIFNSELGDGMQLINTTFENNVASSNGGAIAAINNYYLLMMDCNFYNNRASIGGGIHFSGTSFLLDEQGNYYSGISLSNIMFTKNVAKRGGGGIYIGGNIIFQADNITLIDNKAVIGGALHSITTTEMKIRDSIFTSSYAEEDGGCISIYGGRNLIQRTQFLNCTANNDGGGIKSQMDAILSLESCVFIGCTARFSGGAINNLVSQSLDVRRTLFMNNYASNGAGIYINQLWSGSTIYDSSFINNTALLNGGGISFVSDSRASMNSYFNGNKFESNRAMYGGALYFGTDTTTQRFITFGQIKCSFNRNQAFSGGILYVRNGEYISNDILKEFISSNNSAVSYGNRLASNPISLELFKKSIRVFPGEFFNITLRSYDYYNQTIPQEPIIVKINLNSKFKLIGAYEQTIQRGVINFPFLQILSNESVIPLVIQSNNLQTVINVNISKCPSGYQKIKEGDFYKCEACPEGMYSLEEDSESCDFCPDNAKCFGNKIISESGYWAFINDREVTIHYCSNYKCKGGNQCSDHRDPKSPVCGACIEGFFEWGGVCKKCEDKVSWLWFFLFIGHFIIIFIFYHILSQTKHGGAFIILFFFVQSMLLLVGSAHTYFYWLEPIFDMDLEKFEAIFKVLGCPFERSSIGRILTTVAKPILFFLLLGLIFPFSLLFHWLCTRKKVNEEAQPLLESQSIENINTPQIDQTVESNQNIENLEQTNETSEKKDFKHYWSEFKVFLYNSLIHPSAYSKTFTHLLIISYFIFTKVGFSYLTCLQFGESRFLSMSTDIKCFSPEYNSWLPLFIILIIYSLLFPFVLGLVLLILKRKNLLEKYESYLGGLYEHYKHEYFWYEVLSIFRRTVIIGLDVFCKVFLQEFPGVKYIIMQVVFFILLIIHLKLEPYHSKSENMAERISLIVMIILLILRGSSSFEYSQDWIKILIIIIATLTTLGLFLHALVINGFFSFYKLIKYFKK